MKRPVFYRSWDRLQTGLDRSFPAIILPFKFPLKQAQERSERSKIEKVIIKTAKTSKYMSLLLDVTNINLSQSNMPQY